MTFLVPRLPRRSDRSVNRIAWPVAIAIGLTACVLTGTPGSSEEQPVAAPFAGSQAGSYLAGHHAQMQRDTSAAADFLTDALQADPDNAHLLARTFLAVAAEGRVEDAAKLAERLIEVNGTPLADLVLTIRDLHHQRFTAAESRLTSLTGEGINALMVPLLQAWVQVGLDRPDAALEALSPLTGRSGFQAMYDFHKALINDVADRADPAAEAYTAAAGDDAGMSLRLAELYGSFLERHGRADEARSLYESYVRDHPNSQFLEPAMARLQQSAPPTRPVANATDGVAEALFGIATALRQQRISDTALILGHLTLYLKPDFPLAQLLVAGIYEGNNQLARANDIYRQIAPASPFAWPARMNVASNLDRLDKIDEAARMLRDLAADRPDNPNPLINLGDILRGRERFAEAVEAYDDAFARIGTPEAHHWSVLYARGIALERSKQWPRAEADFLKALEFEPDQPYVLNYLGYSWIDQGIHLERAREMVEKAVELRPKDGYIVDSLGWMHYRLGEFEAATRELERAVELRPQDPIINDHLGDAYWRVGRRQEARFQWRRALSLDPEDDLVATIEDKLKKGLPPAPDKKTENGT